MQIIQSFIKLKLKPNISNKMNKIKQQKRKNKNKTSKLIIVYLFYPVPNKIMKKRGKKH